MKLGFSPERLSPDKLFPRVVNKMVQMTMWSISAENKMERERILFMNPGLKILVHETEVADHPMFKLSFRGVMVEELLGERRKRRYCKGRRTWTTYRKIPEAKKLLKN
jgi:hypothetical protein